MLVKVLWKALSGVANWRIGLAVKFHDVLHWFRADQGRELIPLKKIFSVSW